jgi:MFS transporter, PPP family, 3-phenylpropionic acid transporter
VSMVYFFLFGAVGALSPFLSLYYKQVGLTGTQLGLLSSVTPILLLISQPIFGLLTDRSGHRGRMLARLLVVVAATGALLALGTSFWTLLPLVMLWSFVSSVLVPIADSIALGEAVNTGVSYPRLRLWGSVGFLAVTMVAGRLYRVIDLRWMFGIYAVLMLITWACARRLPAEGITGKRDVWPAVKGLLRHRLLLTFLVLSAIANMAQAAHATFFSVHLMNIGGTTGTVGLAWALAASTEVPVWLILGRINQRTGHWPILAVATVMYGVRFLIYGMITVPSVLVWLQVLQGVSFALFQPTAVVLVGELAGPELRTSGQALLALVNGGVATVLGTMAAGRIVDTWNTAVLYKVAGLVAWVSAAGFLALLAAMRLRTRSAKAGG